MRPVLICLDIQGAELKINIYLWKIIQIIFHFLHQLLIFIEIDL